MENKRDTGGKRLIVVSSVTYALKSYGVYVPQRTDEAERILRDAGVKVFYRAERGEKK